MVLGIWGVHCTCSSESRYHKLQLVLDNYYLPGRLTGLENCSMNWFQKLVECMGL